VTKQTFLTVGPNAASFRKRSAPLGFGGNRVPARQSRFCKVSANFSFVVDRQINVQCGTRNHLAPPNVPRPMTTAAGCLVSPHHYLECGLAGCRGEAEGAAGIAYPISRTENTRGLCHQFGLDVRRNQKCCSASFMPCRKSSTFPQRCGGWRASVHCGPFITSSAVRRASAARNANDRKATRADTSAVCPVHNAKSVRGSGPLLTTSGHHRGSRQKRLSLTRRLVIDLVWLS